MALACYSCLSYLIVKSEQIHDELKFNEEFLREIIEEKASAESLEERILETIIPVFNQNYIMMTTLLSIVIIGLIISYIVLIFYIRKYYYASMKRETWRLTLLFAALNISYVCRVIYLSVRYYNKALI